MATTSQRKRSNYDEIDDEEYERDSPPPANPVNTELVHLSPDDAVAEDDMEEKDEIYNVIRPKQSIDEQVQNVLAGGIEEDGDEEELAQSIKLNTMANHGNYHMDNYLKSTLKKSQRAWVDPWEAAVQDTFYHKQIDNLRPTYDIVNNSIKGPETMNSLFDEAIQIEEDSQIGSNPEDLELEQEEQEKTPAKKFGPWDGVCAGCLLNIFGVIMFLRVGFVVGQAGILQALLIMGISTSVTVLTALSMSAICTNGTILAGGAYYIISRALGPSIGGAIGMLFSIGNMVACSMYLIGFAETLVANLADFGFSIFDDPVSDVRIWSNVVLVFVLILAIVGLKYVIKAQLGLLAFIVVSIVLLFAGAMYRTVYNDSGEVVISPQGWSNGNFAANLGPGYDGYDFWGVLAIFFPAVTGIMAGANISGDLRNPSEDIPTGTLTAIVISTIVYMALGIVAGAVTTRYELQSNELAMSLICVWEYIVLIGIYAATLSSAIASLVGAPRILQAVANDNLFPFKWLQFFAKSDKNGNPIRGYFLSFAVAFACNLIGALNAIAPLISQFFMLTYLLINFACFALEASKSPGWRPTFKYFNKWTAGAGSVICLTIMFLLNWMYALVAAMIAFSLYAYVEWKDPEVNWGNAGQARKYYSAYKAILRLRKTRKHVKNWRPGMLVLVRDPIKRAQMMLFAQTLKKAHGPVFYATVHTGDYRTNIRKFHEAHSLGYLPSNCPKNAKGFYESVLAADFRSGVQNMLQLTGLGSLRPNTLMIGYKRRWRTDADEVINEYVQILRDALVMGMGVMIPVGFKRINWFLAEYAPPALQHDIDDFADVYQGGLNGSRRTSRQPEQPMDTLSVAGTVIEQQSEAPSVAPAHSRATTVMTMPRTSQQAEAALNLSSAWAAGQGKDTVIDVWWMIDDGGLCMLIPYIMKLHTFWGHCKLRMLVVSEDDAVNTDVSTMKSLIDKFRLPYEGPLVVTAKREPEAATVKKYEELAQCKLEETPRPAVTAKWLILTELLFEYSRYSGLNVVTLPIPTKMMKPRMYMAILQMLSDQNRLPPTILMRGNGESTLTFYSE